MGRGSESTSASSRAGARSLSRPSWRWLGAGAEQRVSSVVLRQRKQSLVRAKSPAATSNDCKLLDHPSLAHGTKNCPELG